jgi:hypothetical protein
LRPTRSRGWSARSPRTSTSNSLLLEGAHKNAGASAGSAELVTVCYLDRRGWISRRRRSRSAGRARRRPLRSAARTRGV